LFNLKYYYENDDTFTSSNEMQAVRVTQNYLVRFTSVFFIDPI